MVSNIDSYASVQLNIEIEAQKEETEPNIPFSNDFCKDSFPKL